MQKHFKGKQYNYRIIIEAISLYYHFGLSYRDCAKIMHKFSISVDQGSLDIAIKLRNKVPSDV